jgi:hypothetical protein
MPFEKFEDAQAIDNERRKAIAKSIRVISVEELKKLGEEIFDFARSTVAGNVPFSGHRKSGWHVLSRVRR